MEAQQPPNGNRPLDTKPEEKLLQSNAPYAMMPCTCSVCSSYKCTPQLQAENAVDALAYENCKEISLGSYNWLLELLAASKRPLPGFQVPDTILWSKGDPVSVIKSQSNGRLSKFAKPHMPKDLARNIFELKNRGSSPNVLAKVCYQRRSVFVASGLHFGETRNSYKAVMRSSQPVEAPFTLLTQNEFSRIFTCWNHKKLNPILSLHRLIVLEGSSPEVIRVHYPVSKAQVSSAKTQHCENAAARVIDLLKEVFDIDIRTLSMEFFVTDNESWLNYAWNLSYTTEKKEDSMESKGLDKNSAEYKAKKQDMLSRLQWYKGSVGISKVNFIETLAGAMNDRLSQIRSATGISKIHTSARSLPEAHNHFAAALLLPPVSCLSSESSSTKDMEDYRKKIGSPQSVRGDNKKAFSITMRQSIHRPATARAKNLVKDLSELNPKAASKWGKNLAASRFCAAIKKQTESMLKSKESMGRAKTNRISDI